jgi:hypothetical protein
MHRLAVAVLSRFSVNLLVLALLLLTLHNATTGQVTGIPPYQSFRGGPDVINLGNLNVHYSIPVFSRAGRGMPFSYSLAYDSFIWQPLGGAWFPAGTWGLFRDSAALVGVASYTTHQARCQDPDTGQWEWYNVYNFTSYTDSAGTNHRFSLGVNDRPCGGGNPTATGTATDGSGITMAVTSGPSATVTLPTGQQIVPGLSGASSTAGGPETDNNGNQITRATANGNDVYRHPRKHRSNN